MQTERTTAHDERSAQPLRSRGRGFAVVLMAVVLMAVSSAMAQNASMVPDSTIAAASRVAAAPALIDAPEPQAGSQGDAALPDGSGQGQAAQGRIAPIHAKYILAGVSAQPLGARDKIVIGLKGSYSVTNFGGMFAAAGYEQLRNSQPHFGTDRGAFGERLGAAAVRDTAQGVLSDAVYAPLLHEDPRYYVEGSRYGTLHRAWYALTRPLITRTDSGHPTINGAHLLGYASASAISETFYPPIDRNARDAAETFGGSIGGSALGSLLIEFTSSFWHDLHIGPKE